MGKAKKGATEKPRVFDRNGIVAIIVAAITAVSFLVGFIVRGAVEQPYLRKIDEIVRLIDSASVYYDDKTADEITAGLVKTLLPGDKYAAYYSPNEYNRVRAEDKGNYSGVGVAFKRNASGLYDGTIGRVYFNSPAYKCGIREGDVLVAGVFKGQSEYAEFASLTYGTKSLMQVVLEFLSQFGVGESVQVKVLRGEEELTFEVIKSNYIVSYIEYMDNEKRYYFSTEEDGFHGRAEDGGLAFLSPDTAYIKLCEFEGGAAEQFGEAIGYMKGRGKTKLILDLRDNGGGLTTVLSGIVSYLVNDNGSGKIKILETRGEKEIAGFYTDKNHYDAFLTDISVIANCNTASASEALINALNDYGDPAAHNGARFDLGRLILTEKHPTRQTYCTYGKGIMQTTYGLRSGGALVITTAYVYSPLSDKCIQDLGIETADENNRVSDENAIVRADAVLH
ncbi:MAG: hypothetical protein J5911_06060 [Clostridia bacterium]|nr:hypothetical protein [Clostridia bacterium]